MSKLMRYLFFVLTVSYSMSSLAINSITMVPNPTNAGARSLTNIQTYTDANSVCETGRQAGNIIRCLACKEGQSALLKWTFQGTDSGTGATVSCSMYFQVNYMYDAGVITCPVSFAKYAGPLSVTSNGLTCSLPYDVIPAVTNPVIKFNYSYTRPKAASPPAGGEDESGAEAEAADL